MILPRLMMGLIVLKINQMIIFATSSFTYTNPLFFIVKMKIIEQTKEGGISIANYKL